MHARSQPISARPRSPLSFARPLSRPLGAHTAREGFCVFVRETFRATQDMARIGKNPAQTDHSRALTTHHWSDGRDEASNTLRVALLQHLRAREVRRAPARDVNFGSLQRELRFGCGLRTWTARKSKTRAFGCAIARGAGLERAPIRAPSGPIAPHPAKRAEVQALEG